MTLYSHLELLELSYDYFPCLALPFCCQFPIFDLCSCRSLNFKYHYFTLMILFSSLKQSQAPSNLCQIFRLDFIQSEVSYLIKMCLLLNIYVSKILQFYHLDYYFQNFISRRFLMKRIASYLKKCFRQTFDGLMCFIRKLQKLILCDYKHCYYYLALE